MLHINPKIKPVLDPDFIPASVWNREYRRLATADSESQNLTIILRRPNGSESIYNTLILPHKSDYVALNERYVERLFKFLLWQHGGNRIAIAGYPELCDYLKRVYSAGDAASRRFDYEFMGSRVYGSPMEFVTQSSTGNKASGTSDGQEITHDNPAKPAVNRSRRHLNGHRIGFDLGGSDRKCAALIDGEVVYTEEVEWDPYFQTDPQYHYDQINDSIKRAAEYLPRVDAIGGSAAGVYVDNEVKVASIFRGVPPDLFESRIRRIFFDLQREWGNIPFVVANDGEVTALAGSMSLKANAVLGISMGTSQAGGYVTPEGSITNWLNELAFAPIDYRLDAPIDEWSGDRGVGGQYLSQQAVARLLPLAGIDVPKGLSFAEQLMLAQTLFVEGDTRVVNIFKTIGVYLGYAISHYADFYDLNHVLVLGRVSSGMPGDVIIAEAENVLSVEFPHLYEKISIHVPNERDKRHGQAVAAASLPLLTRQSRNQ